MTVHTTRDGLHYSRLRGKGAAMGIASYGLIALLGCSGSRRDRVRVRRARQPRHLDHDARGDCVVCESAVPEPDLP